MNSELEKLIEKYRITVNGLADLESGYDQVIKERGFVTLNGLLVSGEKQTPPAVESTAAHNTDGAPTPSEPVPPTPSEPATEQPGVTPVTDGAVSGDTNLGTEVASGDEQTPPAVESTENAVNTETHSPSGEERSEENTDAEEESSDEPAAGGKPKKKKK